MDHTAPAQAKNYRLVGVAAELPTVGVVFYTSKVEKLPMSSATNAASNTTVIL